MTDQRKPGDPGEPGQWPEGEVTVTVGGTAMTLTQAKDGMIPALRHRGEQQYPRAADTPELAQQFVDAYSEAHKAQTGEDYVPNTPAADAKTGEDDKPAA